MRSAAAAALAFVLALLPLPRPAQAAQIASVINVADFRTGGRTDAQAIQAAIDSAGPGDTVFFPRGVYLLDAPFSFASDIDYVGDPTVPAILRAAGATAVQIYQNANRPLRRATIRGLHFDNVEIRLYGNSTYSSFTDITFVDCLFANGRRAEEWTSDYMWFAYTVGVTIDGCTFLRNSASGGRGVIFERTRLSVVKDSYFGTTRDLDPAVPDGYFKTAINVLGYDPADPSLRNEDVFVDGNVWRRAVILSCPTGVVCEDHGLYTWGFKDIYIVGNHGDGWSTGSSGGSVKLRNGDDGFIVDNHFMRSGVMMYNYPHSTPPRLFRVRVDGNRIDMLGNDGATGLFYRRTDSAGSSSGAVCQPAGGEDDIYLVDNAFADGGILDVRCAVGTEVCVDGNAGADLNLLAPGVRTSGCVVPDSWDAPLGRILRGDFNGDGEPDYVHRVAIGAEPPYWRAHLSDGDGYRNENWGGNDVRLTTATEDYGIHVGDFDGDGRSDIAYFALCGTPAVECWRVHRSTGTGFQAARNFGDGVWASDETWRYGFHVGNFDGDGRDDLVFRGLCGAEPHSCWTVLRSQPDSTFARQDWGDGAYWDPVETLRYGLLVGDYNGDGRDDIAYPGWCGTGTACMRVHLATGVTDFDEQDWGGGFYFDPALSPHFGMRVRDRNGDGLDDIGYRGRCGDSVPRWRFHLATAGGSFTTYCTTAG
jgi:hypothetical protein